MFSRLKEAISKTGEQQQSSRKKSIDVSFLNPKEIEQYRKHFTEINAHIQEIADIALDNRECLVSYVKEQLEKREKERENEKESEKGEEGEEGEEFTLGQDLQEIQTMLKEVLTRLGKIQATNEEVKERAKTMGSSEVQQQVRRLQSEVKALRASEDNYKEMLSTLRIQTDLFAKQTKTLQERTLKLQRDLSEKTQLVTNLTEEKNVLLEMRNVEQHTPSPELQALKGQLAEADKKLAVERTKLQQKEKEVDTLKKKLEEDRDSLEKIADELKEKELKSKKILDKYERSKTQIRKYREEKTEFIKKLNLQIASLSDRATALQAANIDLTSKLTLANQRNQQLQSDLAKHEGRGMELQSARAELKQLRQEQLASLAVCEEREQEVATLRAQVDQLQAKRKALLQALEKPISHEIRTLDRIIRALEKLYKEYIEVVFTQGNIIGFENKISYILSNVCEIKEDLKL